MKKTILSTHLNRLDLSNRPNNRRLREQEGHFRLLRGPWLKGKTSLGKNMEYKFTERKYETGESIDVRAQNEMENGNSSA